MEQPKKTLVIVESPTKARTIGKFLPKNYTVIASKGHVRDLPEKSMGIDEETYQPKYEIVPGKQSLIKELKGELAQSDQLLLATDEDREGEAISWHLIQVLKPKVPYQRMVFHEITKGAILAALDHGRPLDENLVQAQEARRLVDRLYGYKISPLLSQKLGPKKLSAGRVQSVGLKLTVDRERERISFVSNTYFDAVAHLLSSGGEAYDARLVKVGERSLATGKDFDSVSGSWLGKKSLRLDEKGIKDLVSRLKDATYKVTDIQKKPFTSAPYAPFTTSTLQQEGIRKLHMSASQVMATAQILYENGFITYMRTDSTSLSREGTAAARQLVEKLYGPSFLSPTPRVFKTHSAGAQEAHEAIRPAGTSFRQPEETGLSGRELSLYSMIYKRTLACQMANAQKATTTVTICADDATFNASGTQVVFPGYLKVYVEDIDDPSSSRDDQQTLLPLLAVGETETLCGLEEESHQTKPRARYTEASLVKEMEDRGIGRPSTYATIIKTLLDRSYVEKQNGSLVPTFVGFAVCQYLEDSFGKFVDYDFTKHMEEGLDQIAASSEDEQTFLKAFAEGEDGLGAFIKSASANKEKDLRKIQLPQISEENPIRIGPYGCFVAKETNGKRECVSIPKEWTPATVTDQMVKALLSEGKEALHQDIGDGIVLNSGKYGPYWSKEGKNASIPSWAREEERHDPSFAARYLALPRLLGKNSQGEDVIAALGKYGPYVACNGQYRNLAKNDHDQQLFSITLEQALSLLAEEKKGYSRTKGGARRASATNVAGPSIGNFEEKPIEVVHGRYGYYLKHDGANYALPSQYKRDEASAKSISLDEAISLIQAKRQKDKS